jgi:hypothetical protein
MAFFDAPRPPTPPMPPPPRRPEWFGPPEGWLGGFVPVRLVMARTPELLVCLGRGEAFPTGVQLEMQVITRRPTHGSLSLHDDDNDLRLGVAFDDGRKWQGGRREGAFSDNMPAGPILVPTGGGGSSNEWHQDLWLWPLPPAGPVTFALEWPREGIAETTVVIDGALFRAGADQAEQLWQPPSPEEYEAAIRDATERQRGSFRSRVASMSFALAADDGDGGAEK